MSERRYLILGGSGTTCKWADNTNCNLGNLYVGETYVRPVRDTKNVVISPVISGYEVHESPSIQLHVIEPVPRPMGGSEQHVQLWEQWNP